VADCALVSNYTLGLMFGSFGDGRRLAARNAVLGNSTNPAPPYLSAGILAGCVPLLSNILRATPRTPS